MTLSISLSDMLLSYIKKVEFGYAVELRDFIFGNVLLFVFVKQWRLETHIFHLLWVEAIITLQDVAYHHPIGGCTRNFQQYHRHST
ncbi:hypothetical protein AHAS_Ahas17G0250400 [Arachis hypogaea]